jgi:homocysteine S-methyltransferase
VGELTEQPGVQVVQHQEFDVLAFETLSNVKEAQAICHLLRTEAIEKPAWLSFSCKDGVSLSHGESFAKDALPLAFEVMSYLFRKASV